MHRHDVQSVALAIVLIGGLIGFLALLSLIGAVILRAAVAVRNQLAGEAASSSRVPEPGFLKGMGIVCIVWLANGIIVFVMRLAIAAVVGGERRGIELYAAQLFTLPVSFGILTLLVTVLLPTSFAKAALVSLLYWVVAVVVTILASVLFVLVFGAGTLALG